MHHGWTRIRHVARHRPEIAVFVVAIAIRLLVGSTIAVLGLQARLAPDSGLYTSLVTGRLLGDERLHDAAVRRIYDASWSFLKPIEWVARSPDLVTPFAILFTAIAGALLAAFTTRLLRPYASTGASVVGGLLVAVMPSQVIWSSLLLKDAYIAAAIAGLALAMRWWCEQPTTRRFIAGLGLITLVLLYISRIRVHTLTAVLIGLVLAVLIAAPHRRVLRTVSAVVLLAVIPVTAGAGIAGSQELSELNDGMAEQRARGAFNATTAVVDPPETEAATEVDGNLVDDLLYLPSGVKVMTLDPMPWHLSASRSLIPAFAEHLIWYPLLALAAVGILTRRRWTIDLVFTGLLLAGLIVMWALAEGNFGTAYRHRTEFVWIVVVFAVLGADELRRRRDLRRHPTTTSTTTPINA